jgi:hypothetical protein
VTWQVPPALVMQEAVPLAPFDHEPETLAFATGFSNASCTMIVTFASHLFLEEALAPSRSPTCSVEIAGVGVALGNGVAVGVGGLVGVALGYGVGAGLFVSQLKAASKSSLP